MFLGWIIAIAFSVAGLWLLIFGSIENDEATSKGSIGTVLLLIGSFLIVGLLGGFNSTTPSALDVYRGKTTLEITYKDSVAIDTVVVFKNEFKIK